MVYLSISHKPHNKTCYNLTPKQTINRYTYTTLLYYFLLSFINDLYLFINVFACYPSHIFGALPYLSNGHSPHLLAIAVLLITKKKIYWKTVNANTIFNSVKDIETSTCKISINGVPYTKHISDKFILKTGDRSINLSIRLYMSPISHMK